MNGLNPTSALGELILDLVDAQYDGDYDAGMDALSQTTGLSLEEVEAIINGETVIEDADLLANIARAFPDADDDDLSVLYNVATGVEEEDREALLAQLEAGEGQYQGDEMPAQPQIAASDNFAAYAAQTANFAAHQVQQLQANFEAAQFQQALASRLDNLANFAETAIAAGSLPRSYKSLLIGNFTNSEERLAKFSQVARQNGVDIPTMLFAVEFAFSLLNDAAPYVEFRDYSLSDEDVAIAKFSASLDTVAEKDVAAIFGDTSLI